MTSKKDEMLNRLSSLSEGELEVITAKNKNKIIKSEIINGIHKILSVLKNSYPYEVWRIYQYVFNENAKKSRVCSIIQAEICEGKLNSEDGSSDKKYCSIINPVNVDDEMRLKINTVFVIVKKSIDEQYRQIGGGRFISFDTRFKLNLKEATSDKK